MRTDTADYRDIFLNDRPMMDARAPVEFFKGAFPHTVNLPLMNDLERQKVGTCYKNKGQQAAIELGHQLVSGAIKAERIDSRGELIISCPDAVAVSTDGKDFKRLRVKQVEDLFKDIKPAWTK